MRILPFMPTVAFLIPPFLQKYSKVKTYYNSVFLYTLCSFVIATECGY